jgi:DNA-binding CsgD family transcriptional regulator
VVDFLEKFTKNNLLVLNNIIHHIYSYDQQLEMYEILFKKLKLLIDFSGATLYLTTSYDETVIEKSVSHNVEAAFCEQYIKGYQNIDYSKGLMFTGKSIVYRESDIIPDTQRVETEYYHTFYAKYNFHHSLHLNISSNNRFLGVLSLFRQKNHANFKHDDIEVLNLLTDHLEYRMNKDYLNDIAGDHKLTVSQTVIDHGLTRREEKVLRQLIAGLDNEAICTSLCITNNTLKKHILNIYRKLNINNRVQLFKKIKEKE